MAGGSVRGNLHGSAENSSRSNTDGQAPDGKAAARQMSFASDGRARMTYKPVVDPDEFTATLRNARTANRLRPHISRLEFFAALVASSRTNERAGIKLRAQAVVVGLVESGAEGGVEPARPFGQRILSPVLQPR